MTPRTQRMIRQTLSSWRDAGVTEPDGPLPLLARAVAVRLSEFQAASESHSPARTASVSIPPPTGHSSAGSEPMAKAHTPSASDSRTMAASTPLPTARPATPARTTAAAIRSGMPTSPGATPPKPSGGPLFTSGDIAGFDGWEGDPLPADQRQSSLAIMADEVAGCTRCAELARCRNHTVFGEGTVTPRVVFMGEAPGADEDASGQPFVGRAGKLLTDIIEKGMKLSRADVYILNTIKCRPPGNRNPTPEEAANCEPYLDGQLEILRPEYICCLGAVAAQNLLKTKQAVGKLRGHLIPYRQSQVLVTYHPSYLLRSPNMKAECWKDIQILMAAMGLPAGGSQT